MQQLQLAIFGAAMIALVVCDCIRASSRVAGHLASCGPYSVALFWFPREDDQGGQSEYFSRYRVYHAPPRSPERERSLSVAPHSLPRFAREHFEGGGCPRRFAGQTARDRTTGGGKPMGQRSQDGGYRRSSTELNSANYDSSGNSRPTIFICPKKSASREQHSHRDVGHRSAPHPRLPPLQLPARQPK
jgi:hypothetical protein